MIYMLVCYKTHTMLSTFPDIYVPIVFVWTLIIRRGHKFYSFHGMKIFNYVFFFSLHYPTK